MNQTATQQMHEILIVDDEADIRTSLAGILEDEGYNVRTAENGQQALDMITEKIPHLVLLDIWMEGMDGLEVLSRLKRRVPDLPVIMISVTEQSKQPYKPHKKALTTLLKNHHK